MPAFEHADFMTDTGTIARASLKGTVVGMAHFAGTGPSGAVCGSCTNWVTSPTGKKMICAQYRKMTGDDKKAVPSGTSSCRYFDVRKTA